MSYSAWSTHSQLGRSTARPLAQTTPEGHRLKTPTSHHLQQQSLRGLQPDVLFFMSCWAPVHLIVPNDSHWFSQEAKTLQSSPVLDPHEQRLVGNGLALWWKMPSEWSRMEQVLQKVWKPIKMCNLTRFVWKRLENKKGHLTALFQFIDRNNDEVFYQENTEVHFTGCTGLSCFTNQSKTNPVEPCSTKWVSTQRR